LDIEGFALGTAIAAVRDCHGAGLRSPPRDHGEKVPKEMDGSRFARQLRRTVAKL